MIEQRRLSDHEAQYAMRYLRFLTDVRRKPPSMRIPAARRALIERFVLDMLAQVRVRKG